MNLQSLLLLALVLLLAAFALRTYFRRTRRGGCSACGSCAETNCPMKEL